MKINDILSEWKTDAKIDDLNLDKETSRLISMHAKYSEMLVHQRSVLRSLQISRRSLLRKLREYYLGTLSQEEYTEMNRKPYSIKILKNEVMMYIDGDQELLDLDARIEVQQEKVDLLTDILKAVHARNFHFKNMIDFRRLMLGG